MDTHFKNVEQSASGGKFDPYAGLANSGIAGTGADKEEEDTTKEAAPTTPAPPTATPTIPQQDEEMKDISNKKDSGNIFL